MWIKTERPEDVEILSDDEKDDIDDEDRDD